MSFVLESGCKGIVFWLTNQIFSQKSCLKTYLFNICLHLTRIKLLIYLIKYTHAGAWVCACTYTQITCMAGDAVHGTRIFIFFEHKSYFWTRIKRIKRILMLEEINLARLTNADYVLLPIIARQELYIQHLMKAHFWRTWQNKSACRWCFDW